MQFSEAGTSHSQMATVLGSAAKEAWGKVLLGAKFLCSLHVISNYVCSPVVLEGISMEPTMHDGAIMIVESRPVRSGKIKPGDMVIGISPENPRKLICKRVMGLEGATVEYMSADHRTHSIVVPKGHVWLQGDNISNSRDSRTFGPMPYGLLKGRVASFVQA